jgi:4-amino-4-deoxy-L-arabinose transferase-like glycosyltransferase
VLAAGQRQATHIRPLSRPRVLSSLLVLAICPYFIDLGGSAIWDANEAFYVETPREMMERGDYVSPTFNYEPRLNKPVLSYWIVAGFYSLFGVSPGVQRVPIALGAMVMIATAFWLAWAASPGNGGSPGRAAPSGVSDPGSPASGPATRRMEAALWAALGLAITPRLLMFARRIFIDIYISMFMGLTLLFFALSERHPERRRLFLVLMYGAVGLGVLTKGPIAVVLPGLVLALYLIVHGELRRVGSMMLPTGALIVGALVLPYCAALYAREGWDPIVSFILGENLARYTDGLGVDAHRPAWFYLPVIFSDAFPWSAFLFVAAGAWLRGRRSEGRSPDPSRRIRTLLWLWIAVIVLFFTASAAKQDLYIFPIVPAVAALAGLVIAGGLTNGVRWTAAAIGIAATLAGAGVIYLVSSIAGMYTLDGARWMGLAGIAGGLVVAGAALASRTRTALLAAAATFIVLDWIFVLRVLPGFERYKPVPGFARTLAPRLQPDDEVVTYDEALPSLVYYLRRHVDPYFVADQLIARFQAGRTVYAVLSAENYRDLAHRIGSPTCIIDRRPTFDVKLKNMLARQPLPELLLITNRCPAE